MLNELNSSNNNSSVSSVKQAAIDKRLEAIEDSITATNTRIDNLSGEVTTDKLVADNAVISEKVTSSNGEIDQIVSKSISTENLSATNADIDNLISDVNAQKVTATEVDATKAVIHELEVESEMTTISANAANFEDVNVTGTLYANELETPKYDVGVVNADTVEATDITSTNTITAKDITSDKDETKYLDAEAALVNSATMNSAQITDAVISTGHVATDNIDNAYITTLHNAKDIGTDEINLTNRQTIDDFNILAITPNFEMIELFNDDFDLVMTNAKADDKPIIMVQFAQSQLEVIKNIAYGSDSKIYISIKPTDLDSNLKVRYSAKEEVTIQEYYDVMPSSVTEQYSYKPVALTEMVGFGDTTKSFQFTFLGQLNASISPIFDSANFDSVYINEHLYLYTGTNPETGEKIYSAGEEGQYLAIYDGRPAWRTPLNADTGTITYTDDESGTVTTIDTVVKYNGSTVVNGEAINPITHLGTVTEGTWKAGSLWLNGTEMDEVANDDYSWVLV